MARAVIIDAVRSPIGKFLGSLSELTAPGIATQVIKGLLVRNRIDLSLFQELNAGIVLSAGVGQNPAKQVVVGSGLPSNVATANINMVCASGLRAISFSAAEIESGNADFIIAGGMESMSNAPYILKGIRKFNKLGNIKLRDAAEKARAGGSDIFSYDLEDEMVYDGLWDCYNDLHMGALAEKIGSKYSISRREQDEFALQSHLRAMGAIDKGKFKNEIVPIKTPSGYFETDEGVRRDTSMEKLATLKPAFSANGCVTAGNSSQLSDGASFVILASESKALELALKPLGSIEAYSNSGIDPAWYGLAPTAAIKAVLQRGHHSLEDIGLIELNEAFCVQTLGVVKELGIDKERMNVNGGAIALGHPIGASGARILTTLLHAMTDRKEKLGIAALCHGGGGAAAMLVESWR